MKKLLYRLTTEETGHVYVYYGIAMLLVAIVSQPSVALGLLYQLETLARMLAGQFLSLF